MGESLYKKIRIAAIREEVPGFKSFVFEEGHGVTYRPGQYLTLVITHLGEEHRRSYSITSSPALNEPLTIGVKRVENGLFSRLLVDQAMVGDEWQTTGAGGFFVFPETIDHYEQVFFFAAGSGITPIFSLIKTALHRHSHLSLLLIYSNAAPAKSIFLEELRILEQQFAGRLQLEILFSNTADLSRARLYRGLLLELVAAHLRAAPSRVLYYICGPEAYMRMCTYVLQEEGMPKENIRKENFILSTHPPADAAPPDKNDHQVKISLGENAYHFTVHYPDSILKAAKKRQISLPYSCEAGRCGNCVAKCISGEVWHSYNEVLTEKELAEGLVLTCVGHPVGEGEVVLKM